ncbi:MAG: hypothetical protein KAW56_07250 [Candidatus Marinimicrobia bacterium]|nr:hypothetical protein [Candidatus Neomarinimicrobiota bacterium]
MTIKLPKENIIDKILALFKKTREVVIYDDTAEIYKKYGPYVYIKAKKENLLKTFVRSKKRSTEK